jgi:hypothetical protein
MPESGSEPGDGGTRDVPNGNASAGDRGAGQEESPRRRPFAVLGCIMTVAGFFSGAMVAVLVAKFRSAMIHCVPADSELPACNWEQFAGVGGLLGALTLPVMVYWRLRTSRAGRHGRASAPERGEM